MLIIKLMSNWISKIALMPKNSLMISVDIILMNIIDEYRKEIKLSEFEKYFITRELK